MPSSSSFLPKNVFDMLMERNLSKKSMIKGPTLAEKIKNKKPIVKKIQKANSGAKKPLKPVPPPPTITPPLSNGYRIPKKKGSAPTSGAQKASKPATAVPATPMPTKSRVMKKQAKITEKMLGKIIVKND